MPYLTKNGRRPSNGGRRTAIKTGLALAAALSAASFVTPVSAGPNELPAGAAAPQRAVPGDLGMAIMSAVVNADGTLARGEGVISSGTAGGTGEYEVIFGRDVRACVYPAGIGSPATSGVVPTGQTMVVGRIGAPSGIFVQTSDSTGALVASSFHVIVYCGR